MEPTRRRRAWPWVLVGIAAVALLLCGAGVVATVASSMEPNKEPFVVSSDGYTAPEHDPRLIVLEVTTPGTGNVSWNVNGQGGSDNGTTFPYRKALGPFNTSMVIFSMVVQDTGGKAGALKAQITYGDKVFPCEGSGAYAVVTCTGSG